MGKSNQRFMIAALVSVAAVVHASGCSSRGTATARVSPDDPARETGGTVDEEPDPEGSLDGGGTHDAVADGVSPDARPATGIVQVAIGKSRACRVRAEGTVECWGVNYGDLGFPPTARCSYFGPPSSLETGSGQPCTPTPTLVPGLSQVAEVAVGSSICARLRDGTVRCWGGNEFGALGFAPADSCLPDFNMPDDSTRVPCTAKPTAIAGLADVVQIAASSERWCARTAAGAVACWGRNFDGELGVPSTDVCGPSPSRSFRCTPRPTVVAGLTGVAEIALGGQHTCSRQSDGTVRCWGSGQGLGFTGEDSCKFFSTATPCARRPTAVPGLTAVRAIAAGPDHMCAVEASGIVRCWGENYRGQLGDGTMTPRAEPRVVEGLTASAIFAGNANSCALAVDGSVSCWGSNDFEPFGFTSPECSPDPEQVGRCQLRPRRLIGIAPVTQLATSSSYGCYVLAGGAVHCMGNIIGYTFGV